MEYEKLQKRLQDILEEQEDLNDLAVDENRDLSQSEKRQWDKRDREFKDIEAKLENMKPERRYVTIKGRRYPVADSRLDGPTKLDPHDEDRGKTTMRNAPIIYDTRHIHADVERDTYNFDPDGTEVRDAYNRYLIHGPSGISPEEFRNLQADKPGGGFLVTPAEVAKQIITGLDNEVVIRQYATKIALESAMTFTAPFLASDFGDTTWTCELGTGSEDTDMDLDSRVFSPHPMARRIKVSNKLLRLSSVNPEQLINQRMIQVMSQVLESAYLTGNGVGQPLGVMVADQTGISTGRDTTSSVANSIGADDLINVVQKLKAPYRKNARWILHRDTEARIRKLKTGDGDYIWKQGIEAGMPDRLLGFPVHVSEYQNSSCTTGTYIAILGDCSFYWCVDSLEMTVKRLDELYAETDQTGFICRYEGDGNVAHEDAFSRLKVG